jgi:hypothetical protein
MGALVATVSIVASTYLVSSPSISHADEDGLALAFDEYILLFEHSDTCFSENRYGAIVGSFAHAH